VLFILALRKTVTMNKENGETGRRRKEGKKPREPQGGGLIVLTHSDDSDTLLSHREGYKLKEKGTDNSGYLI